MTFLKIVLLALAGLLIAAAALGLWVNARDRAQAARVWAALEAAREPEPPAYDPAMVADLPEVAQRYFARAVEPLPPRLSDAAAMLTLRVVTAALILAVPCAAVPDHLRPGACSADRAITVGWAKVWLICAGLIWGLIWGLIHAWGLFSLDQVAAARGNRASGCRHGRILLHL